MRKSRFSEVQIVHILWLADAGQKTVGQLRSERGISEKTSVGTCGGLANLTGRWTHEIPHPSSALR
jgi:hypothetical protein